MKKLPTLHILNGDASVPAFKVADLPGQVLVWREILASGPVVYSLPEDAFWRMRRQYLQKHFQATDEDYQQKMAGELRKLNNAAHFFEVVLWFDGDLTCQVNLLYLLHKLSHQKPVIVSVCTPDHGSIGYKKAEQMQQLFEHRVVLDEEHLKQASILWQLYAGPDPQALQSYLQENEIYSTQLHQALQLHLQRFPSCTSGIGKHHELVLAALGNGAGSKPEVYKYFWENGSEYGLGDLQLDILLQELSPELVQLSGDRVMLSETGKQVLKGATRFRKELKYWLGGVNLNQQDLTWCRNADSSKIKLYTEGPLS